MALGVKSRTLVSRLTQFLGLAPMDVRDAICRGSSMLGVERLSLLLQVRFRRMDRPSRWTALVWNRRAKSDGETDGQRLAQTEATARRLCCSECWKPRNWLAGGCSGDAWTT
jgi:hypothetical protein